MRLRWHLACLTLSCVSSMRVSRPAVTTSRTSLLRCCAVTPPPSNLDMLCEAACASLRDALLCGHRGLTVDTSNGALDVTSRAFDARAFARYVLALTQSLTILEGRIVILMPGASGVAAVRGILESAAIWPEDERERLTVTSALVEEPPAPQSGDGDDDEVSKLAAVVVAGLTYSGDEDAYSCTRAWLRASPVALCINTRANTPPIEMAGFEPAYHLWAYTVARSDTWRGDEADLYQEVAGSATLWRAFPGNWRVLLDMTNSGEWSEAASLESRPDDETLRQLLIPRFEDRQANIDTAIRSTGGAAAGAGRTAAGHGLSTAEAGTSRRRDGPDDAVRGGDEDGSGVVDRAGAVCLTWASIDAGRAYGPTALYGAAALLRMRALGADASCDTKRDAYGLHVMVPSRQEDARAAWDESVSRLRGELAAACLLVLDGAGTGIATIEQLAVGSHAGLAAAQAVVARAVKEAQIAGQTAVVAPSLHAYTEGEGLAAAALNAEGFTDEPTLEAAAAMADMADGAVCLLLETVASNPISDEGTTTASNDDIDRSSAASDSGAGYAGTRSNEDQAEERVNEVDPETERSASAEDIARLRRMFGGDLSPPPPGDDE
jgi:hypothetical protein